MDIDKQHYEELLDKERQFDLLIEGGVDNWKYYDDCLQEYWKEKDRQEQLEEGFTEILEILCEGIDEPAGRGAGYGFKEGVQEDAFLRFKELTQKQ